MINLLAVFLVIGASLLGATGALLLKRSSKEYAFHFLWKSGTLWIAVLLYVFSTVLYLLALQRETLSVVFPFVSLNYFWTTLFSVRFLGEKMNTWKWLALGGIIVGVVLIGVGS